MQTHIHHPSLISVMIWVFRAVFLNVWVTIQTWVTKLLWEQFCESTYYHLALLGKYIKSHIFCECNHVYWHCSNVRFITMVHVYIKEIQSPFITRGASLSTKSYQTSQTKLLPFFFFCRSYFMVHKIFTISGIPYKNTKSNLQDHED